MTKFGDALRSKALSALGVGAFERHTVQARRVIFFARYFAQKADANFIEPAHLLRAIHCEVWPLTLKMKLTSEDIRQICGSEGNHPPNDTDVPLSTLSRQAVLEVSFRIAGESGSFCVEPVHLFAAVVEVDDELRRKLEEKGVGKEQLRELLRNPPAYPWMKEMRTGIAYDLHRLEPERKFILGGIEIPFERGPAGHSDGDVLSHAICDALLGAGGLGDIGTHFPDTDPKWKGANSLTFLEHARKLLDERGLRITHIDAVVITEKPKLGPHFPAIKETLAKALGLRPEQINLKAKTNEGVDAIGRGEAIAAHAIATIEG